MRRFGRLRFDPADRVLQFMHFTAYFMQLLVILRVDELVPLDLQVLNPMLQIGLGVNDIFREMSQRI